MPIANRNMATYITTASGNGAADVTVKHYFNVAPAWVDIIPVKATSPTVLSCLVSTSKTNIVFRGESGTTYAIKISK